MINLFTPATDDKSLQYLFKLFGDMNGLISGGQTTAIALFGELFRVFNTIALTVGTLIVVYTTIIGVLKTAAEGEFLGKQWNSLWIPLRMVLGIASLVPTPSGYSGLQIVMMWVIMQGIGAADTVWRTGLAYVDVVGSPYTQSVTIPSMDIKLKMQSLFSTLVCDRSFNQPTNAPAATIINDTSYNYQLCSSADKSGTGPHNQDICKADIFSADKIEKKSGSFFNVKNEPRGSQTLMIGSGSKYCGSLTIESGGDCPSGDNGGFEGKKPEEIQLMLKCRVANAQVNAVKGAVEVMTSYDKALLEVDYQYQYFWENARKNVKNTEPFASNAAAAYSNNKFIQDACDALIKSGALQKSANQTTKGLCTSAAAAAAMGAPPAYVQAKGGNAEQARQVVATIYYPGVIAQFSQPSGAAKTDFIKVLVDNYSVGVAKPVNEYLDYLRNLIKDKVNNPGTLSPAYQEAEKSGWIFAGSYYYMLSQANNANFSTAASATFEVSPSNAIQTAPYYSNSTTAKYFVQVAAGQAGGGGANSALAAGGAGGEAGAQASQLAGDAVNYTGAGWQTMMQQGETDPLVALQAWGFTLLFLVPILWAGLMVIFIVVSFAVSLAPSVLGTGIGSPGTGPYWTAIVLLFPLFFTLFTLLIGVGGLIGIYTPFVPYIIFITGAVGWLIAIVETMVAGPLVALGILAPGGHHDVLGKSEPALMLLFGNFLRPTLMIFGMFAAMLLAPIALDLLNGTFSTVITSIAASALSRGTSTNQSLGTFALIGNPVAALFFLCVYVMLIITLLNKCFAAIHIIPERVMAWISGQGQQYGEAEALGEAKKGSEGAAHGMTQTMSEGKGEGKAGAGAAGHEAKENPKTDKTGESMGAKSGSKKPDGS